METQAVGLRLQAQAQAQGAVPEDCDSCRLSLSLKEQTHLLSFHGLSGWSGPACGSEMLRDPEVSLGNAH